MSSQITDEHGHTVCEAQRRNGYCGVWLDGEITCGLPARCHDAAAPPHRRHLHHRGYAPSGDGRWIDFDVHTLREVERGGGWGKTTKPTPVKPVSDECLSAELIGDPALHFFCLHARLDGRRLEMGRRYSARGADCECPCHVAHATFDVPPGTTAVYIERYTATPRWETGPTPWRVDPAPPVATPPPASSDDDREVVALRALVVEQGQAINLLRARLAAAGVDNW